MVEDGLTFAPLALICLLQAWPFNLYQYVEYRLMTRTHSCLVKFGLELLSSCRYYSYHNYIIVHMCCSLNFAKLIKHHFLPVFFFLLLRTSTLCSKHPACLQKKTCNILVGILLLSVHTHIKLIDYTFINGGSSRRSQNVYIE